MIKNTLDGFNCRLVNREEKISDLEDREWNSPKQSTKKKKKKVQKVKTA